MNILASLEKEQKFVKNSPFAHFQQRLYRTGLGS